MRYLIIFLFLFCTTSNSEASSFKKMTDVELCDSYFKYKGSFNLWKKSRLKEISKRNLDCYRLAEDYFDKVPELRICVNYMAYNDRYSSFRADSISRRKIDCSKYENIAKQKIEQQIAQDKIQQQEKDRVQRQSEEGWKRYNDILERQQRQRNNLNSNRTSTNCIYKYKHNTGMNTVCYYSCPSTYAFTIPSTEICPLNIQK